MARNVDIPRALWIIERRKLDGSLCFAEPQPEAIFGMRAITGITDNEMADVVFRHKPEASMTGADIPSWPAHIDAAFVARRKTW